MSVWNYRLPHYNFAEILGDDNDIFTIAGDIQDFAAIVVDNGSVFMMQGMFKISL